jgi:hypothetical protein
VEPSDDPYVSSFPELGRDGFHSVPNSAFEPGKTGTEWNPSLPSAGALSTSERNRKLSTSPTSPTLNRTQHTVFAGLERVRKNAKRSVKNLTKKLKLSGFVPI